jgi:hypothetical protein
MATRSPALIEYTFKIKLIVPLRTWLPQEFAVCRIKDKGKVAPVLSKLSTMPWRRMGEWMYRSTYSWPNWRWAVSFTARPLYPRGNSPRYPLDRRLGGPQNRSGRGEIKENLDPPGIPTPRPSSPQPVAIPTELSRFVVCRLSNKEMDVV